MQWRALQPLRAGAHHRADCYFYRYYALAAANTCLLERKAGLVLSPCCFLHGHLTSQRLLNGITTASFFHLPSP